MLTTLTKIITDLCKKTFFVERVVGESPVNHRCMGTISSSKKSYDADVWRDFTDFRTPLKLVFRSSKSDSGSGYELVLFRDAVKVSVWLGPDVWWNCTNSIVQWSKAIFRAI